MLARELDVRAVLGIPALGLGVLQIDVEHHELLAGRHSDQCVRPAPPPGADHSSLRACIFESVRRQRGLALGAGKHRHPLRQPERRLEHAHAAASPSSNASGANSNSAASAAALKASARSRDSHSRMLVYCGLPSTRRTVRSAVICGLLGRPIQRWPCDSIAVQSLIRSPVGCSSKVAKPHSATLRIGLNSTHVTVMTRFLSFLYDSYASQPLPSQRDLEQRPQAADRICHAALGNEPQHERAGRHFHFVPPLRNGAAHLRAAPCASLRDLEKLELDMSVLEFVKLFLCRLEL